MLPLDRYATEPLTCSPSAVVVNEQVETLYGSSLVRRDDL